MNIIRRLFCKHDFKAPYKTPIGPWKTELVEVPSNFGQMIKVQRQYFEVISVCKHCGFLKKSSGHNQRGCEDDPFDTSKPSKATTNENTYGKFHD